MSTEANRGYNKLDELDHLNDLPEEIVRIRWGKIMLESNDFWEKLISEMKEYLWLSKEELEFVETYEAKGYFLVWEKYIDEDYPIYYKRFIKTYKRHIKTWEEIEFARVANKGIEDRVFKNLIMIKLDIETTVDDLRERYMPDLPDYSQIVRQLLDNLPANN